MSWICLKGHVKTKEYIDIASTPISNNNFILSELLTDVLRIFSLFKSFQLFGIAVQFWEQHQKVKKTSEIKRSFNNKQGHLVLLLHHKWFVMFQCYILVTYQQLISSKETGRVINQYVVAYPRMLRPWSYIPSGILTDPSLKVSKQRNKHEY